MAEITLIQQKKTAGIKKIRGKKRDNQLLNNPDFNISEPYFLSVILKGDMAFFCQSVFWIVFPFSFEEQFTLCSKYNMV